MKLLLIVGIWAILVFILAILYKLIIKKVLVLNKEILTWLDEIWLAIDSQLIDKSTQILDFEKTFDVLMQEREQLLTNVLGLQNLHQNFELLKQQDEFVSQLLTTQSWLEEITQQIEKLFEVNRFLCFFKKFLENILIILTLGLFIWLKNKIWNNIYIYC